MTLPEALEQAIIEHGLAAEAYFEAFLHLPTKVNRRFAEKVESADALRSAILAYGAARERQGIERAKDKLMAMVEEYGAMAEASVFREPSDDYRVKANALGIAYVRLGALPVDGATP